MKIAKMVALAAVLLFAATASAQVTAFPSDSEGGGGIDTTALGSYNLCVETGLTTTTTGTVEEVMATCTIPGGSLGGDFSGYIVTATWVGAANTNSRTARVRVDGLSGTVISTQTDTTSANDIQTSVQMLVDGAGSLSGQGTHTWGTGTDTVYSVTASGLTFASDIDIVATGETGTQLGDITLTSFRVVLISAYGAAAPTLFPLAGPDGCLTPPFSFSNGADQGLCRGLAAAWGFDSVVLQADDFETLGYGTVIQAWSTTNAPGGILFNVTNAALDGATEFLAHSTAGQPAQWTASAFDLTAGIADVLLSAQASQAGDAFFSVTVDEPGPLQSVTTFAGDNTTFTDPIHLPAGTAALPGMAFTGNLTSGFYGEADADRLSMSLNGAPAVSWRADFGHIFWNPNFAAGTRRAFAFNVSATNAGMSVYKPNETVPFGLLNCGVTNGCSLQLNDGAISNKLIFGKADTTPATIEWTDASGVSYGVRLTASPVPGGFEDITLPNATGTVALVETNQIFVPFGVAGAPGFSFAGDATSGLGHDGVEVLTLRNYFPANTYDTSLAFEDGTVSIAVDGPTTDDSLTEFANDEFNFLTSGATNVGLAVSEGSGGLFVTNGAKPTCVVGLRGRLWRTESGAGVADLWEICEKNAADAYAWTAQDGGANSVLYGSTQSVSGGVDFTSDGTVAFSADDGGGTSATATLDTVTPDITLALSDGSDAANLVMGIDQFEAEVDNSGTGADGGQLVMDSTIAKLEAIGYSSQNVALEVAIDKGVRVLSPESQPTCAVGIRGNMWRTEGGAGVADTFEVCAKNSSDTYAWFALATIP